MRLSHAEMLLFMPNHDSKVKRDYMFLNHCYNSLDILRNGAMNCSIID